MVHEVQPDRGRMDGNNGVPLLPYGYGTLTGWLTI